MDLEKLVLPLEVGDKMFKTGIAGAIAGTTALIGAMGLAIKTTFDWASQLDAIGDVMDVTNDEAAALNFTLRKSGVATETFTKGVVILSKGLVKADGSLDTVGKSLGAWGINVKDATGQLKGQADIIDEVSKKYNTLGTQQEKVNFLTEVFGRSGAELIDFFDVMAAEGGLDAVTEKVKAFGLAIDPARYEQFQRNLEELKLIGTGLAVTFTENLMPALENILGWVTRFAGEDISGKFAMLSDPLKMLFNLTDAFSRGIEDTDWAGLSQRIADGINNIDWNLAGQYIRQGITNVLHGIETIVQEIDWQALADALGNATAELVAGLFGYTDWDALAVDFNAGLEVVFGGIDDITFTWEGFVNTLKEIWQSFVDFIASTKIQADLTPGRNVIGGDFGGGGSSGLASNQMVTTPGRNVQGGNKRASGGAVIAGQQYQVAEFFRPETFTPSTNGRVDPMQSATANMGQDEFLQRFAEVITRSLRSELQKAGRK